MSGPVIAPGSPLPTQVIARDEPMAWFGGRLATDLLEVADLAEDPAALERGGWWAVLVTFEGAMTGYRFGRVIAAPLPQPADGISWSGPAPEDWTTSLDRNQYLTGVQDIRRRIAAGDVYQVNLCRMLSARLPATADPIALAGRLALGNPAPHQGLLNTGSEWVVTASPELFLSKNGRTVASSPMKGTSPPGQPFAEKDVPENIMITDLVRNDLGRVAMPGSVVVDRLLAREEHPGLAHLVSTVRAQLRDDVGWAELLGATLPPGSISGAPKHAALRVISELEAVPRGPYCGAIGFVDAGRDEAVLAVGIRTFFTTTTAAGRRLNFGTGAGITYASDPDQEWAETELKAARLIDLAST